MRMRAGCIDNSFHHKPLRKATCGTRRWAGNCREASKTICVRRYKTAALPYPSCAHASQGSVVCIINIASSCRLVVCPAATSFTCPWYRSAGAREGPYTQVPLTLGWVQWKVGPFGLCRAPPPSPPQLMCTLLGGGESGVVNQKPYVCAIRHRMFSQKGTHGQVRRRDS